MSWERSNEMAAVTVCGLGQRLMTLSVQDSLLGRWSKIKRIVMVMFVLAARSTRADIPPQHIEFDAFVPPVTFALRRGGTVYYRHVRLLQLSIACDNAAGTTAYRSAVSSTYISANSGAVTPYAGTITTYAAYTSASSTAYTSATANSGTILTYTADGTARSTVHAEGAADTGPIAYVAYSPTTNYYRTSGDANTCRAADRTAFRRACLETYIIAGERERTPTDSLTPQPNIG